MRALLAALGLMAATACTRPGIQSVEAAVSLSPAEVELGRVWVGLPTRFELMAINSSQAPVEVALDLPPGLTGPTSLRLAGGDEHTQHFELTATQPGEFAGEVIARFGDSSVRVAVHANAEQPLSCLPSNECLRSSFDPRTGVCLQSTQPDGISCTATNACLTGATCLEGVCVGTARECHDGNPCTADACDPVAGCTFTDSIESCAASTDPCHAPSCDPETGCSLQEVLDGTPCGVSDCNTSQVCVSGQCETRLTPEGAACGAETRCRSAGTCLNHVCVGGTETPLTPAWVLAVPHASSFPGVVDRLGNLYWFEDTGITLASATHDGLLRFRVPLTAAPRSGDDESQSMAIIDDRVFLMPWGAATTLIEARSPVNGQILWSTGSTQLKPLLGLSASAQIWVLSLTDQAENHRVIANIRSNSGGASWLSAVVALDTRTGAVVWVRTSDYLDGLLTDGAGNTWVYENLFTHSVISLTPDGIDRFALSASEQPLAAAGALVMTQSYPLVARLVNGQQGPAFQNATAWVGHAQPRVTAKTVTVFGGINGCMRNIHRFDASTGQRSGLVDRQSICLRDATITNDEALFVRQLDLSGGLHRLIQFEPTGATRFNCPIAVRSAGSAGVLDGERYVMWDLFSKELVAWDMPGLKVGSGWVMANGNAQRNRRPR